MARQNIQRHMPPEDRDALLKWISNPEVRSQLEAVAACDHVMSITVTPTDLNWMASDLTHAIVTKGCRDSLAIDLSERLEHAHESRDDRLESWYGRRFANRTRRA